MTDIARALPNAKYKGDNEELKGQTQGPKVIPAASISNQVVLKRPGPPPYGQRTGWRPRTRDDFGDGGAFPEISVAQYPLDMGRKEAKTSNALAITVNSQGRTDYTALARQGHGANHIVQASFKDLIPLRARAEAGEVDLSRPGPEEVEETRQRTEEALSKLIANANAAQNPKNVRGLSRNSATYVKYQATAQMGDTDQPRERIIKIVERQIDPMEPPKHKHKKIPRGPPSPPPPVLHSPPRKPTAAEQEAWRIPPSVSNWKNPKGYTIPLDKRLAADGRGKFERLHPFEKYDASGEKLTTYTGIHDVQISDEHAKLAQALADAEKSAREAVRQRQAMQEKLAQKEKQQKEDNLRMLAQKAREERAQISNRRDSGTRSRERSYDSDVSDYDSEGDRARRQREEDRRERRRENEKKLRQSHMGHERRVQLAAREAGRDISEKIALGIAKPTASGESMYDSRLFNQSSGLAAGFNEDQPYDKPLFAAQEGIKSIYRPKIQEDLEEDADETMKQIQKSASKRFDGFKGAKDAVDREGPVQFEKDKTRELRNTKAAAKGDEEDDPFGIADMIADIERKTKKRKYGLNDPTEDHKGKKARVDDEESS